VRAFLSSVFPQSLYGIEFRGVGRKIVDLNPFAIFSKPVPYVSISVVRSAIMDVVNATVLFKEFGDRRFQENRIGPGFEDVVNHKIKLRRMKVYASKNLYRLSLASYRHHGLAANS
jgi:hypothetical protein